MKQLLTASFILLAICASSYAQNDVTLTPEILDQRVRIDDPRFVTVEVDLRLTLRNNMDRPVIFVGTDGVNDFDLRSVRLYAKSDSHFPLYRDGGGGTSNVGDEYRSEVRGRFEVDPPPQHLARVLAKDETIVFEEKLQLSIHKVATPSLGIESWMTVLAASPLNLILTYQMFPSFLDLRDAERGTFGLALRTRWQRFGHLWIDQLSTSIELDLERSPKRVEIEPRELPH